MSLILLILGIVVAAAGIATIGFGIPISEFTLGTTLIITGTTGLTGGLILIGLSAVVTELGRVVEGLKGGRPAGRGETAAREPQEPAMPPPVAEPVVPPAPAIPPVATAHRAPPQPTSPARPVPEVAVRPRQAEPQPAGPSTVEVSSAAIERLRSSIPRTERPRIEPPRMEPPAVEDVPLSPNGIGHHQAPAPRGPDIAPPQPRVLPEDRAGGSAVEALKASRLDFLFRSKRQAQQPESFDSLWPDEEGLGESQGPGQPQVPPQVPGQGRGGELQPPRADRAERAPGPVGPPERRKEASSAAPAILKSGVVDGMAYTLYADGSIEAKLPQGTVRFGSIAELRAHIESNS